MCPSVVWWSVCFVISCLDVLGGLFCAIYYIRIDMERSHKNGSFRDPTRAPPKHNFRIYLIKRIYLERIIYVAYFQRYGSKQENFASVSLRDCPHNCSAMMLIVIWFRPFGCFCFQLLTAKSKVTQRNCVGPNL